MKISLATNVSTIDSGCVRWIFPHWKRVFSSFFSEFIIIVDPIPPQGRIAFQNNREIELTKSNELLKELNELNATDPRVKILTYNPRLTETESALDKWFGLDRPYRCHSGTPIAPFIFAINQSSNDVVLRCDSDMIFFGTNWLIEGLTLLESNKYDILGVPRMSASLQENEPPSTRALLIHKKRIESALLPMKAWKTDPARRIYRWLQGNSAWLPLEQMLFKEVEKGRFRFKNLNSPTDKTMHVGFRKYLKAPHIDNIISDFELGKIPERQLASGWDLDLELW